MFAGILLQRPLNPSCFLQNEIFDLFVSGTKEQLSLTDLGFAIKCLGVKVTDEDLTMLYKSEGTLLYNDLDQGWSNFLYGWQKSDPKTLAGTKKCLKCLVVNILHKKAIK